MLNDFNILFWLWTFGFASCGTIAVLALIHRFSSKKEDDHINFSI